MTIILTKQKFKRLSRKRISKMLAKGANLTVVKGGSR